MLDKKHIYNLICQLSFFMNKFFQH